MADKKLVQRIKDVAKQYPDGYTECRTIGHGWKSLEAGWLKDGNIERVLGCTRCEARRIQVLNKQGYLIHSHYNYPDGYAMKGVGRLDADGRAILRITSVAKQLG